MEALEKKIAIFIIVDYKSANRTIRYIKHLCKKIHEKVIFIVIDNSDDETNYSLFAEEFNLISSEKFDRYSYCLCEYQNNRIYTVDVGENLGYAKGNNLGLKIVNRVIQAKSGFVIFTNNDLQIISDKLDLDVFRTIFQQYGNVGIIGPEIIGVDNKKQSPCKKISFMKRWILPSLLYPLYKIVNLNLGSDIIKDICSGYVYRVQGSFMVCDLGILEVVGGFDSNTFLYGEESILSERIKRVNSYVFYTDKIQILHEHDQTIGSYYKDLEKIELRYLSEVYYYRTYLNVPSLYIRLGNICVKHYTFKKKCVSRLKSGLSKKR